MSERRTTLIIVGPTPPPYHGMSVYTQQLLDSPLLAEAFDLLHLETADRRSMENMGQLEWRNLYLGLLHALRLGGLVLRERHPIVYIEISQNEWAYLRDAVLIGVAKLGGARVVTHLHGSYLREFYERTTPLHRWVVRLTSRWLSAAAVLGKGLRSIYDGLVPPERVHVVPNGIADPFPSGPPPRRGRRTGVRVLYLGALYRPKGLLDLLRAFGILNADRARREIAAGAEASPDHSGPTLSLTLAGDWVEEGDRIEGEAMIREEGIEELVEFAGVVTGEAKRELLADADILVFPGRQAEGLPLVILEAMAAGIPVITTDRGAISDAVTDRENGLIVPVGEPDTLAAAISQLAADPELRAELGRRGRERFRAYFTAEEGVAQLVEMLRAIDR